MRKARLALKIIGEAGDLTEILWDLLLQTWNLQENYTLANRYSLLKSSTDDAMSWYDKQLFFLIF